MLDVIHLLPDSIANQIAAGEVVQRPASVVKELLENAVDARADNIQLIVKEAGKTLVQVIDDGAGMSETDARLCFERHATSKIRTSDDLFKIRTMGFRGEAMASIAAVAQVELRTRRAVDEIGTLIRIEGSEVKTQESVGCLVGANILVKNLFFNVPARRNFLKTNAVEMRHILDEFQRVALAHPHIGFALYHNDTEVFNLSAGKLSRRIVDMFGKNYREQLVTCQEETPYVTVRGYVGKPDFARKTRGEQYFFVNDRFIKHSYLHHAVLSAYEGAIADGSHPFYALFLDIDPSHIDINIHPTKTEIKFDDERSVYAIIMATIRRSLNINNIRPSIDFEANANFLSPSPASRLRQFPDSESLQQKWENPERLQRDNTGRTNVENWSKLFEGLANNTDNEVVQTTFLDPEPATPTITLGSRANRVAADSTDDFEAQGLSLQIQNKYIISAMKSGAILIDQRAGYERILFDRYRATFSKRSGASQQLVFPKTVRLTPADCALILEIKDLILALGFDFDAIGTDTFLVRGIPADMPAEDEQKSFEALAEQIKESYGELKTGQSDALARSLAKRFSRHYLTKLSPLELTKLIDQLFASSNPNYTPTGELIFTMLTPERLAGLLATKG